MGFEFLKTKKKNLVFLIFGFLIFLNVLAWIAVYELSQLRFLEISFFDVGQGDAIFVETPQKHQILIDGGPSSAILEKLAAEMPFWDRSLDLIILTHPENDHLAGLIEVLKQYQVENILWTGVVKETSEYKEWLRLIKEEGAKIFIGKAGQKITCQKRSFTPTPGFHLDTKMRPCQFSLNILYPLENLEGQAPKNTNDTSIVAKLIFKENSFLFTGDIYQSGELKLIEAGFNIDSDVLKVAHHGSKTSSAEEFIEKVSPKIGVIQVGENKYGHPHQEVLLNLEKFGINILRTDKNGNIKILSNGKSLWLLTQR